MASSDFSDSGSETSSELMSREHIIGASSLSLSTSSEDHRGHEREHHKEHEKDCERKCESLEDDCEKSKCIEEKKCKCGEKKCKCKKKSKKKIKKSIRKALKKEIRRKEERGDRGERRGDRGDRGEWKWVQGQDWSSSHPSSYSSHPNESCDRGSSCADECFDCEVPRKYTSCLTPCEEVDFVLSKAQGSFEATGQSAGLTYQLDLFNIDKINHVTINLGHRHQNGPVVVVLHQPSTSSGTVNGTLLRGTINQNNLTGPLKGECFDGLIKLMNQGLAYINVSTDVYPTGEIRGQIISRPCH